ncbi:MAG TPA: hypothetical protein VIM75_09950 [Ohtaekwangia sp.]|uniref:hypothetical protein n=1 Tax=Ohtaekwangia sp. TaxID=2066019 RepID=UPI002F92BC7D
MNLNFYNFLFYCYYSLFTSAKRKEAMDHILASLLLSVIISFNLLALISFTDVFSEVYEMLSLSIPVLVLFIVSYTAHWCYFISTDRYQRIIKKYEHREGNKKVYSVLAIVLTAFTLALFWISGVHVA